MHVYYFIYHLSKIPRGYHLALALIQILYPYQFFYYLSSCCSCTDSVLSYLLPQLLILDEVSGIFHGSDQCSGGISLGRGCLALPDLIAANRDHIAFFSILNKLQELFLGYTNVLFVFSPICALRPLLLREPRNLHISRIHQNFSRGKKLLAQNRNLEFGRIISGRGIEYGQEPSCNQHIYIPGKR